ncbi:MAG: hypothetical protein RL077_3990 [Verrucomicrobiota bacterium]
MTRGGDGGPDVAGELGGFGGVDFFMDFFRGAREFGLGQPVFLFGIIRCGDFDRAQSDYLCAGNDADFFAPPRAGQPRAEILPCVRDRQSFHFDG